MNIKFQNVQANFSNHCMLVFMPADFNYRIKATGGPRVKNEVIFIFKISLRGKGCKKSHEKILFLAKVMIFFKSRFACNYSTCKNLKSPAQKFTNGTFI